MKRILFVLTLVMTLFSTTSCSNDGDGKGNPLVSEFKTPFGVPPFDIIKTEHYDPAITYAMSQHNDEIAAILANQEIGRAHV